MIPETLKARRQWLLWRSERSTKVPYQIGGKARASSTDPRTWAPYHDVAREYERNPNMYSGIGYVLSGDDGLTGVDLDDCRNPKTGALSDEAVGILDRLNTYTEISPSGTGVKAWVVGTLDRAVKTPRVEVYPRGRYFAVTGQRLDRYPPEPQPAQEALDWLAANYGKADTPAPLAASPPTQDSHKERWARDVLARAVGMVTRALDGEKHNELLDAARLAAGAIPHVSAQEVEAALFAVISPRAKDRRLAMQTIRDGMKLGEAAPLAPPEPPTSDALVVRDGRPWCPRCGGEVRRSKYAYPGTSEPGWYCPECKHPMVWPAGAFTLAAPVPAQPGVEPSAVIYATAPPTPTTAPELARKAIEPTRYYIQDMLRSGLALFIGNPGIGKTPALIQLALAFAAGGMWLGAIPCRKSRVLYIGVEYDEAYIKEVLIDSAGTTDLPIDLFILSVETFSSPATEEDSIAMLSYYLDVMHIDVLVIDVFSGFLPREKFKQNAYRGDYAEFLAYHRMCMAKKALLVGAWHGTKRDKDPEMAYNGGQGMWGSAGGGRLTMFYDDDQAVRLRSQLRGHERKEWVLEKARVGGAHFWSVIDADPDPIFGSDAQRRIYQAIKKYATPAEPLTPAGVRGILKADNPENDVKDAYIRQFLGRLEERGILSKLNGGYIVKQRGSGGSLGSGGSGGSGGSQGDAHPSHTENAQDAIQGGSLFQGTWIAPPGHWDADNDVPIQAIHRSTQRASDPPIHDDDRALDDPEQSAAQSLADRLRKRKDGAA